MGLAGFEPATSCMQNMRSTKLPLQATMSYVRFELTSGWLTATYSTIKLVRSIFLPPVGLEPTTLELQIQRST